MHHCVASPVMDVVFFCVDLTVVNAFTGFVYSYNTNLLLTHNPCQKSMSWLHSHRNTQLRMTQKQLSRRTSFTLFLVPEFLVLLFA